VEHMERDEDAPAPIPPAGISGSGVTSSIDDTSTGRDRGNSPTGVRATEKVGRFGRPKGGFDFLFDFSFFWRSIWIDTLVGRSL
jgi:hypothetical protein